MSTGTRRDQSSEQFYEKAAGWVDNLTLVFGVALWSLAVYYAANQNLTRTKYALILFGIAFLVYILDEIAESLADRDLLDVALLSICAVVVTASTVYLERNFQALIFERVGTAYQHEYILAIVVSLTIFYLTYRAYGMAFAGVMILAGWYALYGYYAPGVFGHTGISPTRLLRELVLEFNGFYGSITAIVAAWVALFLLYAGLLKGYGAFDYIMRIAFRISKYVESGIAQSAVVASIAIGSINGAATANAAMTGSVTIPLMKRSGLRSSSAAAIESVASSGGQIMPPVMGSAAFIMASLLQITYAEVLVAGLIPAFVFYASVVVAVHYKAINQDIATAKTMDLAEEEGLEYSTLPEFIFETVKFGIPFAILIYILAILQWQVMTAALYACVAMVITGVTFPLIERAIGWGDTTLREIGEQTLAGIKFGAVTFAPIAIIVAAINGIVDVFVMTGVPGSLALALIDLSGGVLIIALVLAMFISIILGLGMPTVAAYTIVALLVAPALIENFDIPRISVHYFVFYAAILSGLTPPIAIAVVVTTGIAQSNFWRTAIEAIKIAAPLFVLPFAFIYHPETVVTGNTSMRLITLVLVFLGAVSIVHGLNYYKKVFDFQPFNWVLSTAFVVLGVVTMVYPETLVQIGAAVVAIVLFSAQRILVDDVPVGIPEAVGGKP